MHTIWVEPEYLQVGERRLAIKERSSENVWEVHHTPPDRRQRRKSGLSLKA